MTINFNKQKGTTMIEVLVSMIILSLGLLGSAMVQFVTMKNSNNSEHRFRASVIAADMMERMQSNQAGVSANQYDNIIVNQNSQSSCNDSSSIAKMDMCAWENKIAALPNGSGVVNKSNNNYVITISWQEQNTSGIGNSTLMNQYELTMTN